MQKTMNKTLSIILAILMIVTTVPFAFAAESDTEGTTIVITMEDICYDGWSGNAIVIEQLIDGTYTEVATATFEDGESETFTVVLTEEGFYTFKWKEGDYPDECIFTLEVDDEVILKVTDCSALSDGECFYEYVLCNHNYVDGKCDICGSDCPHKNITDSKCDACGAEGKFISIAMIDSYGDGWNGNAIQLDLVSKGEFTKFADATIETGAIAATYRTVISSGEAFSLKWKEGDYPDECSFTVKVNGEIVFEKSDCSDLADNERIYINCNHNFIDSICSICGLTCGVDFSHKMNGGTECTACGFVCNHNYVNHYCMSCGYVEDGYYAGACGADDVNDAIWSLDSEGTLIISGEGEYDIPYVDVPWSVYGENIKNVVIEEGITNIVYSSFYDLPNTVTLSIPSTVASIDAEGNNGFVEIKLADGNNYYSVIDGVLFNYDKTELIMYPAKKAGETYTVPDGVTTLGFASFRDVKNLKTVNISDDVTTIKYGCFAYSNSIENINFGKNVQHIEENAFLSTHVKTIVLPEKLTEISFSLFYDCDLLENLVIGSNVTKIGNYVLDYCDELETVHFTGTEEQWQAITKPDNSEDAINTIEVHFGALEEKEDIDATCAEAGHTSGLYCDECNAYITGEEIPATGNHSVENGLCTECNLECGVDFAHSMKDGRCEDCGFICPHELYIDGKCTVCQKECSHIPGDQICTGYICKICGTVFGDEGDNTHHAWNYGECGYCGEPYPQDRPCTHIWNYNRSRCRLCGIYCSHETIVDNICTECNFVVMPFSLTTGETVTYHGSFPDALDNAQDGSAIKLLKDYDDYENIEINKVITLDLNGKEWYQPSSGYWNVYANATFTDSVGGGYLDYSLHFYSPVTISGGSYGYLSIDFETENTLGDYLADCCSYFDTDTDELIDADDEKIVSYVTVKAGHDLGSQTCKGYQCKECGEYFGEADPDAHDWSNLDGICANGCGLECAHEYFNQERIRPVQNADGTWSKGTVKAICSTCGCVFAEKEAERDHEGYAAFEKSVAELEALLNREDLIDGPKNDYTGALNNLKNVAYSLVYMEDEATMNRLTADIDTYISAIEAGLADGTMKKADWTYMTALFEEINAIIDNDYHNIISSMNSYYLGPQGYYNGCSNSPTFTQASYNGNIHFEKQLETLLAGLKDGTALKADYTKIDEAIAEIEEKLADENVTDEAKAGLEEIKAQLEEMKADKNTSAAELAELEKALEEYEAELDAGIEDGSAVKVNGQEIFNEKIQEINDELIEKYGEEIKEFSAALPDEVVAGIEKRTTAIYNEMTSLEGSVKDNEEKLAEFKAELEAIFAELENCFTGTHNGLKFEVTAEAKCGENAIESATCTLCGETVTREVENSALTHSFTKYEVTEEAKCGVEGKKVAACDNGCGATDEKAIEALTHTDADGDYKCDNGCGHEFEKPAPEEPTPDTPDEPADEACDHLCHKGGFMGFIWKIVKFFSKLFKANPVCECGAAHY